MSAAVTLLDVLLGLGIPLAADAFGVFLMRQIMRRLPDALPGADRALREW